DVITRSVDAAPVVASGCVPGGVRRDVDDVDERGHDPCDRAERPVDRGRIIEVGPGVAPGAQGLVGVVEVLGGGTHRASLASSKTILAKMCAASACIPGRTCWYTLIVKATLACPRRSLTTLAGTPSFSRIVAWVWRRSCRRIRGASDAETRRSNVWL